MMRAATAAMQPAPCGGVSCAGSHRQTLPDCPPLSNACTSSGAINHISAFQSPCLRSDGAVLSIISGSALVGNTRIGCADAAFEIARMRIALAEAARSVIISRSFGGALKDFTMEKLQAPTI